MQSRSIAGDISQRNGLTETATSSSNLDGSRNTRHVWKYAWKLNIASPDTKKVYCGHYTCLFFFYSGSYDIWNEGQQIRVNTLWILNHI